MMNDLYYGQASTQQSTFMIMETQSLQELQENLYYSHAKMSLWQDSPIAILGTPVTAAHLLQ